jgi:tetratricopeptide (TPR) repeat protein
VSAPIPFGNYELLERIAEGGMAEVWRARSRGVAGFEKAVVIKRVLPSLLERPGFAELLVREAKIAARLSHPNIVQIFDLGELEGSYFIAMELLRGRDLAAALSHRASGESPLTLPLRLWIAAEVAKALDYAHRVEGDDGKPLSIVHRDVSPQNVLLGYEGEVKVADFGIARADEPGLGRGEDPKILRGKYAYMSPEQARGEPLDRRSDIFSFGILLYELATRRRMFRGKTSSETLELVRAAELPDVRARLPLPALAPILERALAPERHERYRSAGEIHAALVRLVHALGEPVGPLDLAAAMRAMFPPSERASPNKLRVDLLSRAYDDATAASEPGRPQQRAEATVPVASGTRALPTVERQRAEVRRLAFFAARGRAGEERLFEAAAASTGGAVLPVDRGVRLAAYGVAGMERAADHAARGALELRRTTRLEGPERLEASPPMAVLSGRGRILEGVPIEAEPELVERAAALLALTDPGEIRADPDLRPALGRDFRFRELEDGLAIEGFRARRDRDAGAMRRRAPLVGRRRLLRSLSGLLVDAARGEGELVHLVGEPGVGKSRLLAELRAAAAPKDFVFVHGRADEADAERSFGALADLVQDLCGIEPEDAPAQRFDKVERLRVLGLRPREVRLLGELVGLAYPLPAETRPGRPRGIELALAIRRALRKLSEDRVVVLALEDLQWMDDATRQVLPLVIDGLVRSRVLVLLTRRPGSAGPLPAGGRTLEIRPLDAPATGRLLAHWLGVRAVEPDLAAHVARSTGGIPAWIELVAEPAKGAIEVEDGVARPKGGRTPAIPLPEPVRAVMAARLERLRPRDRSMLRVAAALGGAVEVALLSAVEGLIGHTERPPLRRLLLRRLLVSDGAEAAHARPPEARLGAWGGDEEDERLPTRVRLPSELARQAVLAELDGAELERLHGRIVSTLERRGAAASLEGLEQLARHARSAADRRRASAYLIRAGEAARRDGAHERAARHFARAAQGLRDERGPADAEAFALGLRAADEALRAGALERAEEALAPLAGAVEGVEPELAVRWAVAEARRALRRLAPRRAIEVLEGGRPRLDAAAPPLRAEAYLLLGRALLEHGESERAVEVLGEAARQAEDAPRGRALAAWAVALAKADRLDRADAAVSEALAVAARLGAAELRYASLAAMAAVLEARDEPAAAAARHREAAEVARSAGAPEAVPALEAHAALGALAAGDDAEAARRADAAARHAREGRQEAWGLVAGAVQAALAIREHPEAIHVPRIVRSVERLEALGRPGEAAMAVEMLAWAHLALDDPAAAARTLERARALAERAGDRAHARRLAARRESVGAP